MYLEYEDKAFSQGEKAGAGPHADATLGEEEEEGQELPPSPSTAPESSAQDGGSSWLEEGRIPGVGLSAGGGAPKMTRLVNLRLLPKFPDSSVVGYARVPGPPRLAEDADDHQLVGGLLRAYRQALEVVFRGGKKAFRQPYRFGVEEGGQTWERLLDSAKMLRENKIAPLTWAWWSMQQWLEAKRASDDKKSKKNSNPKPPFIDWVFGRKRVLGQEGWFYRDMGISLGCQLIITTSHRELLNRHYYLMRVASDSDRSDETVKALVKEILPPSMYARLVQRTKLEQAEALSKIRNDIKQGRWIW